MKCAFCKVIQKEWLLWANNKVSYSKPSDLLILRCPQTPLKNIVSYWQYRHPTDSSVLSCMSSLKNGATLAMDYLETSWTGSKFKCVRRPTSRVSGITLSL